ncbi:MAG TPA: T9SS type A sorting domain-containing protein [Flavobacteriales bacterium]|nr:T9SS type A sorting domain-containing protein [Flavobacteriales bacterium]
MDSSLLKRVWIASVMALAIISMIIVVEPQNSLKTYDTYQSMHLPLFSETPFTEKGQYLQNARAAYELAKLADPETGEIPMGMRKRELRWIQNLRLQFQGKKASSHVWKSMGPANVGGRTRAMAIDVTNENVILAGGVSSGVWRSVDQGLTWTKVTAKGQHHSVTTIAQDTRTGKTNVWYYGSGEGSGNSASKSFSGYYYGNGVYKSTDGGITWDTLGSTVSGTPQTSDTWDLIWRIAIDPSIDSVDILYATTEGSLYRSEDGGTTWTEPLNIGLTSGAIATDIAVSATGITYFTVSSGAANKGIWRSMDHGLTWTNISNGSGWPGTHDRTVLAINPLNENSVYLLAHSPNYGQQSNVFFGGIEWNSLWKYRYLGGDGAASNGVWTDLSANLPNSGTPIDNFNAQGGYDLIVAVKPDDSNTVFVGGTNLYRSTDGFTSPNNITHIGGYGAGSTIPFYDVYLNHHPDNHAVAFIPSNPDMMISSTDGGVFKTNDCMASTVAWTNLNNGYTTTQFYTIAIDHGPANSDVIFGGLQDNGTWWTKSSDPSAAWTMPSAGDGSYCAVSDGGGSYYFSRQNGKMVKTTLDVNGVPTAFNRMDPILTDSTSTYDYLFINPFILDPSDNNVMYLAQFYHVWRNDNLNAIPLTNEWDTISTGWSELNTPTISGSTYITALACSKSNPSNRVYYGTFNAKMYRIDSANTGNPTGYEITNNIQYGGYTSCIAVDPRDADKVMVVYSTYNTYSVFYSENGGAEWGRVAGNLETGPPVGAPAFLEHIGDGPSCRWAQIIPMADTTLYLLGTSVGLFSTNKLVADTVTTDSTVWVPESDDIVGNVVVDMIDYRQSDGFVVLGTHGNGVYSTHMYEDTSGWVSNENENILGKQKTAFELKAYPNPADNFTTFSFKTEESSHVQLVIFSRSGKRIVTLINEQLSKGKHSVNFDLKNLAAGIYLYRFTSGKDSQTGKLVKH